MTTLFEKLGGAEAINSAVDKFYAKALTDDRINRFLYGTDIKEQAHQLKMFLTYAFGGVDSYPGRGMRAAHQKLVDEQGLSDKHFDAVIENLAATLAEMDVTDDLIAQVAAVAETIRDDVLCR